MQIKDKKIVVTGGANGIGKALTTKLLDMGAKVWALDISEEGLSLLKDELKSDNLNTYALDISNKDALKKFHEDFKKENGNLDILINNAGIVQPFVNAIDLDDKTIDRVMNINFYGPVNLTKLFLKDLVDNKDGAYIVNVSSMGGFFPFPSQTIYGASKAAIKIFTEGLYAELADTKVNCMVVFPGAINTNIVKNSNVEMKEMGGGSSMKLTSPEAAAEIIINGILKNKFKVFIGPDAKFMKFIYKLNSKAAINFINKKMK